MESVKNINQTVRSGYVLDVSELGGVEVGFNRRHYLLSNEVFCHFGKVICEGDGSQIVYVGW